MEFSRITFTKDTLNKMNKDLTKQDISKLRYQKLQELDESGRLSLIKTRKQLAMAVGYSIDEFLSKGSSWVNRMLKRGYISETFLGFDKRTHIPEHEYHLTGIKPNFTGGRQKMKIINPVADEKTFTKILENTPHPALNDISNETIKIRITKQDIYIEIELNDNSCVGNLINQLLNNV